MSALIENKNRPDQLTFPFSIGVNGALWRPIHYLGSKLRLVDSIRENLDELDPRSGAVCDLFSGSGTVSRALCSSRKVIAADIQEYSRVLCSALLRPAALDENTIGNISDAARANELRLANKLGPILEFEQEALARVFDHPEMLCDIAERGSLLPVSARDDDAIGRAVLRTQRQISGDASRLMVTRYFGGRYFSYRQSLQLDCALAVIDDLPRSHRDTCLAAILSTASSVVNSIGKQFAQPMRLRRKDGSIKRHLIGQMHRDRSQDAGEMFEAWLFRYCALPRYGSHRIICGDYRQVLEQLKNVSVIYADPPYTRDHYSRFYHVLETLCLRDSPQLSATLLTGKGATSRGLYRTVRHQSPFCIKSQAPAAFSELFARSKKIGVPLLVSYSPFIKGGHPRLMTVDAVAELASQHYPRVEVVPAGRFAHSKLNKGELHLNPPHVAEVFIRCRT